MATAAINPNNALYAKKRKPTYIHAKAAQKNFVRKIYQNIIQEHVLELEKIATDCDTFQQNISEQEKDLYHRSLVKQVNEWERDSITKIKQIAEDCRRKLIKLTDDNIAEIKKKLNQFITDFKKIRDDDDFHEIHLNKLRLLLEELKKRLQQPLNVSILEKRTSFINKISIITKASISG
ncbi:unnamed protein product [Rotaria magnacalcarata]|uniref:Uncharacterized protein n=1 Tax=Rotaria magnacalcarata TaxID=392030 RepID=A0A814YU22_9BILA|nr:unnamed protein product [Rotaria magnacalcarata]CAF4971508.1 unnamed protein product [Rotaria magnacalcarata]